MCPSPVHSTLKYQCSLILWPHRQILNCSSNKPPAPFMCKSHLNIQTAPFHSQPLWKLCAKHGMVQAWHHICLQLLILTTCLPYSSQKCWSILFLYIKQTMQNIWLTHGKKYRGFWAWGDALLTDLLGSSKHIHSLQAVPLVLLNQHSLAWAQ